MSILPSGGSIDLTAFSTDRSNMQQSMRVYDSVQFEQHFKNGRLFDQISKDVDKVSFNWHFQVSDDFVGTCRQWYGDRDRKTVFSATPFYYINYLIENYDGKIYDIGCGWNIFKKYLPSIVGVDKVLDQQTWRPDIDSYFDEDFQAKYHGTLDRIMSINALHFIQLHQLRQRVQDFFSLLAPNGLGFLALNLMRMIELDQNLVYRSNSELEDFVRTELFDIGYEYLVFDIDLSQRDSYMDGNIRMVVHNKVQN